MLVGCEPEEGATVLEQVADPFHVIYPFQVIAELIEKDGLR
jgi:hypothetical protein